MRSVSFLPIPAKRALYKFGTDLKDARRRRRISTLMMAERASISRSTLHKIENGDQHVALGFYTSVLFVLGMVERITDIADVRNDETGLALEEENLPKRIRNPSSQ